MRSHGERQTLERIPTLEDGHHSSARVLTRDADHDVGEPAEILIGQREPAERIAGARVEAGGDHHQLRLEALRGGDEAFTERAENLLAPGTSGKRIVDDEPASFALALLVGTAGAGIPRVLMTVEEQHHPVGPENLLRAVAVV